METLEGRVEQIEIADEMRASYLDYAMSVIVGRALPDVRDGLKPVHRRVLFGMHDSGMRPTSPYRKCARVVGDVMGNFHPHGDASIYDALVRMAQDFSIRYPLVDGHGNFGSVDGDAAAAMRYTECRLSKIAMELLRDIEAETVDWTPNYDESREEPKVLPSRFPNLLVNGSSGIAVGMATNIPPHNLGEAIAATVAYIDDPGLSNAELMRFIKGPDFPTGGLIMGSAGIREGYETGRGRVVVRARAHTEPLKQGKVAIIVTELPYQVNKAQLIEKIADLVREKHIPEISDLRDESDRSGMRIVIELKREAIPKVVLNKLFKHSAMQTTFGINMLALVDGVPKTLSLRDMLRHYVAHQKDVIVRRTRFELDKAKKRAHILEGLLIAITNLDEVIRIIRSSEDAEAAKMGLMERFGLSDEQAQAIVDLRLRNLTALERHKIEEEHRDLLERIAYLEGLLADEALIYDVIKEELLEIKQMYGDDRRTEILPSEDEIDIEDMIAVEEMVISITASGYVKRLPVSTYRLQHRGGIGVMGMDHQRGRLHRAPLHHHHASLPAVHHLPGQDLPAEGARTAPGEPAEQGAARGQPTPSGSGGEDQGRHRHQGLHRRQVPGFRHAEGHRQEDPVPGLRHHPQGRRHHRHQPGRRRRTGGGGAHQRSRRSDPGVERGQGHPLPRVRRPADRAQHHGRDGHAHASGARSSWAWRWPRTTPTSSASPAEDTASAPRSRATPPRSGGARA